MKKVLFTLALCVAATASFAQKKAVSEAQSIAKGQNPDFGEARILIKGALENAETKDDAKTWFVAGQIEDQQFSNERTKQVLGQQPNEPVMYDALYAILPYFEKAVVLDQQPNEKGKIKPRFTKDIKSILSANHVYYINGGAYYFDQQKYKEAYDFFEQYIAISNMDIFKDTPTAARDSNFMMVQFYAAAAASLMKDSKLAIAALERAKAFDYRANDVYQYLCFEYEQAKDSVKLEQTLEEGMKKFPEEPYYLLSLINSYIYSNRNEKAIEFLDAAIAKDGNNAQLYDVKGRVYENIKDYANAETNFQKALEINPEYIESLTNLGRVYYNQAVNKKDEANALTDKAEYEKAEAAAKDLFKKALPYFEKAHKLKPDARDNMIALRGIYYNLNMNAEFDAIEAEMNQ